MAAPFHGPDLSPLKTIAVASRLLRHEGPSSARTDSVVKTRGVVHLWDKSVGSLMTGQTTTGVEGA
jgi:hypothetical protein